MKIEKIYIFKDLDKKSNYLYILYTNGKLKTIKNKDKNYMNHLASQYLEKLAKQKKCSKHELIKNKNVIVTNSNNLTIKDEISETKSIDMSFSYANNLSSLFIINNLYSIINNRVINFSCYRFSHLNFLINLSTSLMFYWFNLFVNGKSHSKLNNKTKLRLALLISTSLISIVEALNIPDISTIPYYKEIMDTDVDDLIDNEGLNELEYRDKAIKLVFDNLEDNPYLSDADYNILMKLEDYCEDNPYIDYNLLYHNLLTIRHRCLKNINPNNNIAGEYFINPNVIITYNTDLLASNMYISDNNHVMTYEEVMLHEAVHSSGGLSTTYLDEGMTSLIVSEYFSNGNINNGYGINVQITKLFCDLVGSDTMLKAFSLKDETIIKEKLIEVLGNEVYVDAFYKLCKNVTESKTIEEYSSRFYATLLTIDNITDGSFDADKYFDDIIYGNPKAYFSSDYKKYVKLYDNSLSGEY